MVDPKTKQDDEFRLNREHLEKKAWMEANGLEEPLGCKNPLDILIMLEVEIEIELN